jgi:hypothetical protein
MNKLGIMNAKSEIVPMQAHASFLDLGVAITECCHKPRQPLPDPTAAALHKGRTSEREKQQPAGEGAGALPQGESDYTSRSTKFKIETPIVSDS